MATRARDPGGRRRRVRITILAKLLLAFAVPTVALFAVFAYVAHEVARRDLEAELGTRLGAIAASAALPIRGKYLASLGPGDRDDRAYQNTLRKLEAVREATGASRLYILDRDFTSRVDTDPDVPIGTHYFQAELDRHELLRVFERGDAVSSVLFRGRDGVQYKAGYAPVRASETESEVVLALGVDAPATYFTRLADLRRSLLLYGAILAVVVLAISIVVAARITRPVRRLAAAAERIGKGDLAAPVARTSHDEIGLLAETMDQMRADLAARDEHMQLMLAGIAHEVRNPLGGIELFTGILRDELEEGDERREHVDRITRELGYLSAVVNDFLDYARRPPLEWADIDLAELVRDVAELVGREAGDAGVPIAVHASSAPCRGDAGQLRRAILNLARNAVQAASRDPDGAGAVTLTARLASASEGPSEASSASSSSIDRDRDGDSDGDGDGQDNRRAGRGAEVIVHNRGPAIPPDVIERIFEPFYTTREKGTGLGLAFVQEIVADHGGAVTVTSGDDGTAFRLCVPASG